MSSSPLVKPEPLQGDSKRVNMSSPLMGATTTGKKKYKQPTIISLLDSDDDDEVVFAGSSTPRMKTGPPKHEQIWKKMTIPEKMDALKRERKCLRKAQESCEDEGLNKIIMARRNELRVLSAGLHFKVWQPPNPSLFDAIPFHKYDMNEALRLTIDSPASRAAGSSTQAGSTVEQRAGPFGQGSAPWTPGSASTAGIAAPFSSTRPPSDMSGKAADALQAVHSTFGGLVNNMKLLAEGAGNLFNQPFGSGGFGAAIPGLPGPSTFPLPDFLRGRAAFDEDLGMEVDRPAE